MKVYCDECESIIDTDIDFSMFLTLDEGLDTERKLCFCSILCATTWTNKQGVSE